LRAQIHFRWYRWRLVLFSCFVLPNSFSAVPRASAPVFMFCAPGIIFGGLEGVGSRFHVLRYRTHFGGAECVGSRLHVLRSRTCFRRNRGRRVPFSSFARPDLFSAVPSASGPVFKFCAPRLIFRGAEGIGSLFLVLRSRTHFRLSPRVSGPVFTFRAPGLIFGGAECVGSCFHVLRSLTRFRRYGGRRVPFSCFAVPD
jgi:hypothetical protein